MTPEQIYQILMSGARHSDDPATLALAGVLALQAHRKPPYDAAITGLDERELQLLKSWYFPRAAIGLAAHGTASCANESDTDEFGDLLALLMASRTIHDDRSYWLAHAIATASMGTNHLWQDMGLPSRKTLSALLHDYFAPLASRNVNDMKWKKFFYRELCAQAGLVLCRSPNCSTCTDYPVCFGTEDAIQNPALHFQALPPSVEK